MSDWERYPVATAPGSEFVDPRHSLGQSKARLKAVLQTRCSECMFRRAF